MNMTKPETITTNGETKTYDYGRILDASIRSEWRIEDIIGGDRQLDFSRSFLPETLVRANELTFLDDNEKKIYNQIRAHAYLCIFGIVEEFILPFVMDHARTRLDEDDHRIRALLQFAGEEARHIHLFRIFKQEFEKSFGHTCDVIGPAEAIAKAVLAHDPLGIALTILHIEWFTQRHYLESIRDDADLDPQFKSLLRHHWMDEAQHAKMDTLMVKELASGCTKEQLQEGFDQYLEIGDIIDDGLRQQMEFDLDALERACGRSFGDDEKELFRASQLPANRWTYLGSGMTHPEVLGTLEALSPELRTNLEGLAPRFC